MTTKEQVIEELKQIQDPELFLDIWFLGLIYSIDIGEDNGRIEIEMTFTSPMCPAGPSLVGQVKERLSALEGVKEVEVKITFSPPWQPSDDVKAMLGMI